MQSHATTSFVDHFWAGFDRSGGPDACWVWTRSHSKGYGNTSVNGKIRKTHRVAWELTNGPIPDGLEVCHNCPGGDNKACGNPVHLYLGTHRDNMLDAQRKGQMASGARGGWNTRRDRLMATRIHGESHHKARLTAEQVCTIRERYARGGVSQESLGREYGVPQTQISEIVRYKAWAHVA